MRLNRSNTLAYIFQVWVSFVVAAGGTCIGIAYLPVDAWTKGFLGMGLLFTIGSCFSLAKTIRDEQEAKSVAAAPSAEGHPFRRAA